MWQIHKKLIPTCRVLAIRVETIFVFLKVNNLQNNPEYLFRSSKQNTELSEGRKRDWDCCGLPAWKFQGRGDVAGPRMGRI